MERAFSVDDILGTFWKLDTQGDSCGSAWPSAGRAHVAAGCCSGVEWAEEEMQRQGTDAAEAAWQAWGSGANGSTAFHKGLLPRSASEWEFQELLRMQAVGDDRNYIAEEEEEQEESEQDGLLVAVATKTEQDCHVTALQQPAEKAEEGLEQPEVKVALNPLFAGLRDEAVPAAPSPANPREYENFLKQRLHLACAAALTRVTKLGLHNASSQAKEHHKNAPPLPEGAVRVSGPLGIPALPPTSEHKAGVGKATTSGSSREQSDDDEGEVDGGHEQIPGALDIKRVKRMLSNRESARRSRRRKQAHLSDLELQVAQLRVENSTLVKQLNDISHKLSEAVVDNRVLKADVEALRAKVKMAQDMVARAAGVTNSHHGGTSKHPAYLPSSISGQGEARGQYVNVRQPVSTPVPAQPEEEEKAHQAGVKMGRTPSMQRIASLEHLQKRTRGGSSCNASSWGGWDDGPAMVDGAIIDH